MADIVASERLDAMLEAFRADIDSEPYPAPLAVSAVSTPATPGQGAGCSIRLAAAVCLVSAVYLLVHIVVAVTR